MSPVFLRPGAQETLAKVCPVQLVEIAVRQFQQAGEQLAPQVVDEPQRNPRQIVIAEKKADALPENHDDDQQRYAVGQFHFPDQRESVTRQAALAG